MRTLPTGVDTLLKSKSMIGTNKPSYRVDIGGVETALPVKSINISREKNMAASLSMTIENKNGDWAPDGTVHAEVLWPNEAITVYLGYGTNIVKVFTGYIDSISLSTFPQELTVTARDSLKYALDQIVSVAITGGTSHNLTYTNQTIEYIVGDLITKAGMTAGTVDSTGITLAEKTFSWCTYMDALQELADVAGGYEYGATEEGVIYFRKDKIADTPTTSYVFKEGEDILSLGYDLDDNAVYYKVAVYGKSPDTLDVDGNVTEEGHVVFADALFSSRVYYGILEQKIMKIDAQEATTVAQCQAIADEAVRLMASRVRICSFEAVAVPWLQCGDYIQVIETSTTISELYRITNLSFDYSDSGATMSITCYHHSYAA